jgi:hypothetical protein
MTAAQQRFVRLHQNHHVVKWQWIFGETMLRAYTESGDAATISRTELELLVDAGVMRRGKGFDVHLTEREVA